MTEPEATPDELVTLELSYVLPSSDMLYRSQPAILEGPRERWECARSIIDFGCALIELHRHMRGERKIRDACLIGLLRRAVITAEGVFDLLARGLEEPALAAMRTLLDIELNARLIARDPTDQMAKRYAAYHYYGSQRHGQRMLADRETRETVLDRAQTVAVARNYAQMLEDPIFDEVREAVKKSQYWHGHPSVKEAFIAAGMASDYFMSYDSFTFFVHDSNVDFDFADSLDGQLRLRPLVQRDPSRTRVPLSMMMLRLHSILGVIIDERGLPPELSATEPEPEVPEGTVRIDSYEGLTHMMLGVLDISRSELDASDRAEAPPAQFGPSA